MDTLRLTFEDGGSLSIEMDEYQQKNQTSVLTYEGEKNHKKGGLNCVFGNFFFYVLDNCPQVQSLSEFRVYVQRIM